MISGESSPVLLKLATAEELFSSTSEKGYAGAGDIANLAEQLLSQWQNNLPTRAASKGLPPTDIADLGNGADAESGENTAAKPIALATDVLESTPLLGAGLLEALMLGVSSLYAVNRFSGSKISRWVQKLLPASAWVVATQSERIVVVFKLLSASGLQRLVAARVDADKLKILAQQVLPMSLSAAAAPRLADLEPHLRKLLQRMSNLAAFDLLLFDPHLRQELPVYESLGRKQAELRPQTFGSILSSLEPSHLVELRSWINHPSGIDLRQHPVGDRLAKRQRELHQYMDTDKASLVSLIELSLALGERFA